MLDPEKDSLNNRESDLYGKCLEQSETEARFYVPAQSHVSCHLYEDHIHTVL